VSYGVLWRFLDRHKDHAQKKTAHPSEQDRPDIVKRREVWFEGQLDLDPQRLVFIDETWASTNMARQYGRAPRGQRRRKRAARSLDNDDFRRRAPTDGNDSAHGSRRTDQRPRVQAYVDQVLVPELKPGDADLMTTSDRTWAQVRRSIEAAGARLLYLPPYSRSI
jgi:hypothetical protein